ncbi:hypothetical protein N658DRAFT_522609 [Parathielavia hyrcaniae]|uniref:Uncharacterized protein n=1 Tax=Parathielavia hyrcaniae TaxID=113614 RepID=A0AAN6T3U9_9PEZI|nr:hypothetical protein N658DRAFT_522609 [Parathielavia hyrcaniae]
MPFHLQTHQTNRPPLQVLEDPRARPSYASSNLPPHLILRLHHLRHLSHNRGSRTESIHRALHETQARVGRLLTEDFLPWADLNQQWQREQLRSPTLTHQAYQAAHNTIRTNPFPPSPPPPTLLLPPYPSPSTSPSSSQTQTQIQLQTQTYLLRQHQTHTNPSLLAYTTFHRARHARLRLAQAEAHDFIEHRHARWLDLATARYRAWQRRRHPLRHPKRHCVADEAAWCGRMLGLNTAGEFDAHRWGVRLQVGRLSGRVGGGEWPGQVWFCVYKRKRYGRAEGRCERAVAWGTAFGSGMWLCGGSPLRRVVAVDEEMVGGGGGGGVKRKLEEV